MGDGDKEQTELDLIRKRVESLNQGLAAYLRGLIARLKWEASG